jgi:hypothetical protein
VEYPFCASADHFRNLIRKSDVHRHNLLGLSLTRPFSLPFKLSTAGQKANTTGLYFRGMSAMITRRDVVAQCEHDCHGTTAVIS